MNIEQTNLIAARKHAMEFHRRNGVKELSEIRAHELDWPELCNLEGEAKREARSLLDKTEAASADHAAAIELALDAFTALLDAISAEKDVRTYLGDKNKRANADNPMRIAKRPGVNVGEVRTDSGEPESQEAFSLAPEQRFTTWAEARDNGGEYRGLGLGQYLRAMVLGGKTDLERRALSEGTDGAGGYTVPDILSAQLIDRLRAQSVAIRAGAMTVPLTSDQNFYAKLLTDPTPAWRAEAGAVADSDPTFGRIALTPRSLAVQVKVSQELLEDSLNISTALPNVLAAAMALELDRVALLGTGTAPQPRGVANTSGSVFHM
jgi:HK97 family phage major capsid protein